MGCSQEGGLTEREGKRGRNMPTLTRAENESDATMQEGSHPTVNTYEKFPQKGRKKIPKCSSATTIFVFQPFERGSRTM